MGPEPRQGRLKRLPQDASIAPNGAPMPVGRRSTGLASLRAAFARGYYQTP